MLYQSMIKGKRILKYRNLLYVDVLIHAYRHKQLHELSSISLVSTFSDENYDRQNGYCTLCVVEIHHSISCS